MADIGGFKDGVLMALGGVLAAFDSRFFALDLNRSLFKVRPSDARQSRRTRRGSADFDGARMVSMTDLK